MIETFTPVLILRSTYHGGLGILRSLGRLGVPVYVLDPDKSAPAARSRFCSGWFSWDLHGSEPARSVEYLTSIAQRLRISPILYPTTDHAALFVEEHAEELAPWFIFPRQPAGLATSLACKKTMHHLALRSGIPVPATCFPQSLDDVIRFAKETEFPVILKETSRTGTQGVSPKAIAWTRQELMEAYQRFDRPGEPNVVVQEFIPGGEQANWMFNGYFDEQSECIFGMTGKKIRQHPAYAGVTSLGICQSNHALEAVVRTFMKKIGYRGMLDCGFRYDQRDGKYKVFDVNPRIGSSFRLFVSDNGMDVARAAYLHMTAQSVQPGTAVRGRKWMVEDFDVSSSLQYRRDGNLTLWDWLRSFQGVRETAFAAIDDPKPALAVFYSRLRQVLAMGRETVQSHYGDRDLRVRGAGPAPSTAPVYGNESEGS